MPPASNLTPAGEISGWADADFITTMRTGINPAGKALDSFMPYRYIGRLTDDELLAIYLYLKTLPAMPIGGKVDFLAISAHKFGGPQGIGVAVVPEPLVALVRGGHQERDRPQAPACYH